VSTNETQSPSHYVRPGMAEVIDVIRAALGEVRFRSGFCHGNVIKYALRAGHKGSGTYEQDMIKVANYALWAAGRDPRDDLDLTRPCRHTVQDGTDPDGGVVEDASC